MAAIGLALVFLWVVLVAGVRSYIRLRRTGDVGIRVRDHPGSAQWWARLVSTLGLVFAVAAPLAELAGLPALSLLDHLAVRATGVLLVALGIVVTMASQLAMGASWRADVDPEARTELVTTGPFRLVRNPTFTGTATTAIGLALVVPNVLAVAMLIAFLTALEIQVRLVEEPYLRRLHGDAYRRYAARTGRFLPWIGRERL
jgi:protein-S-isoprenylcysteine O-methyltransferase Ste14